MPTFALRAHPAAVLALRCAPRAAAQPQDDPADAHLAPGLHRAPAGSRLVIVRRGHGAVFHERRRRRRAAGRLDRGGAEEFRGGPARDAGAALGEQQRRCPMPRSATNSPKSHPAPRGGRGDRPCTIKQRPDGTGHQGRARSTGRSARRGAAAEGAHRRRLRALHLGARQLRQQRTQGRDAWRWPCSARISLGGEQEGYASLVDLNTGRVVWFNRSTACRATCASRDPPMETVEALLKDFPGMQ